MSLTRVERCHRETSTIPIQVSHKTTQTEREEPGESSDSDSGKARFKVSSKVSKCERSTSTSPPPSPSSSMRPSRRLEELEKITGYIIIQRFITRTDEEFQDRIKIRFPADELSSNANANTSMMTSHPQPSGGENSQEISRPPPTPPPPVTSESISTICNNEAKSGTDVDRKVMGLAECSPLENPILGTLDTVTVTDSLLSQPTTTTTLEPQSKPSVNEESLTVFEAALGLLPQTQDDEVQQSLLKEDRPLPEVETKADPTPSCGSRPDGIPCECFKSTSGWNEKKVSLELNKQCNTDLESYAAQSQAQIPDEIHFLNRRDSDGSSSTASSADLTTSVNYEGEKDDEGLSDSESHIALETSELKYDSKPGGSTVGTQTDQMMRIMSSSDQSSRPNSAKSSLTSSSVTGDSSLSLIDVQLRVEKLDLRVRVGGSHRKATSVRIPLPHIRFKDVAPQAETVAPLLVKGQGLGRRQSNQGSQSTTTTTLPKI